MTPDIRRIRRGLAALPAVLLAAIGADGVLAGSDRISELADNVEICRAPDPRNPSSAFEIETSEPDDRGDYWMTYRCREPCADWTQCRAPSYSSRGEALMDGDAPRQALAFVVDSMGGHLSFTAGRRDGGTVLLHSGIGGTMYTGRRTAEGIEEASDAGTVMLRWDAGYTAGSAPQTAEWGWFTRTSPDATRVWRLNERVAGAIAWVHENLAGSGGFGTVGCSMGAQATFGAVYWHGLDDAVDYQLFIGGPPLWDINAGCGRRAYSEGYCDADAARACVGHADCAGSGHDDGRCVAPGTIPLAPLYESVINHVHATSLCDIRQAGAADAGPYEPFDESSLAFSDGDWDFDHPVDFHVDLGPPQDLEGGRIGGDEDWALGHFMRVFNSVESKAGHEKRWMTRRDADHCESFYDGKAAEAVLSGMGLK